jgi:eukaryotic-like serine/threonine-protein kinase
MELVDGVRITDFCDQNHLSTRERLELFIQVCHAVQHAHQKGIIHRDIKPSNILVTLTDGVPVPKVIDFGIAKATHGKLTDKTFFTALEHFIGTPAYMSPEQADAREVDIDTRSDIYSLGVLLYELLTGRTPFDAKELLQSGLDEIRRSIREREPAAPSTRLSTMEGATLRDVAIHRKADAPQLIHMVRGDLDWIVMKALEKDRARRYETTNGLALDIRRHLNNEPVAARPPSRAYQFQKLVRRNRLVFTAGAVIVLALAIGVAVSIRASIKEHQARLEADIQRLQAQINEQKAEAAQAKAEAEQQKAQAEAAKNQQIAQFLEDMLDGVGPSVALGADTTLLKKILDNTSKRIGADLTNAPEVEANLRDTLGQVYWEIGDLTNAETMHRAALALRLKTLGRKTPETAESMEHLSHVLWREGKLDDAAALALNGLTIQVELYGKTNIAAARSLENYAAILNTEGQTGKATSALREALVIKEAILGNDNLEVADTMDDLSGLSFSMHANPQKAMAMRRQALAIRENILGSNNPVVIIGSLQLEKFDEDQQGRSADEEATLDKLVEVQRQFYGGAHPDLARTLNTLASVLKNEDKLSDSERVRREALTMQQRLLGGENAEVAQTLENLGDLLILENKLADAEPLLRSSYSMREKMFGDHNALTASAMVDLGAVLEKEGKTAEAANFYNTLTGGNSASAVTADYRLGLMYLQGTGMQRNPQEGADWILKSARLGHTDAEVTAGVLFFNGTGVPRDEGQSLAWFNKAAKSDNAGAMKSLANCYCAAGRAKEAINTLKQFSNTHPTDHEASLTLAVWQLWFGDQSGYESSRRRIMKSAAGTDDAAVAQAAAKAWCLRPSSDPVLLSNALDFATYAVDLRQNTLWLPWYQLSLGLAQYRNGKYSDAEQTLAAAEQPAEKYKDLTPTAGLFRAMCLFQEGRQAEARQLFSQTQSQMIPLPQDPNMPVVDGETASHDIIISWLAFREAQSLLNGSGGAAGN